MKKSKVIIISLILIGFVITYGLRLSLAKPKDLIESVIIIDPGHGGKDNGATHLDLIEDEMNLKISKMLYNKLFSKSHLVYLTRNGDYDLATENTKNRKKEDLNNRVKFTNSIKPDVFISIHLNKFDSSEVNGAQVFYYKDDCLANSIQNELNTFNIKSKKEKKGDYYILRNINFPSCLIECGFISGQEDYYKLKDENHLNKLVEAIAMGIKKYLNK